MMQNGLSPHLGQDTQKWKADPMGKQTQSSPKGLRVLTTMPGSGQFGERLQDAHVYTLDSNPEALTLRPVSEYHANVTRTDIDVGAGVLAFQIDNVLTHAEADALVDVSDAMGYTKFAPGITTAPGMRRNKACQWFCSQHTAEAFLMPMFDRFRHLLPQEIDGTPLYPYLSHRFAHYKYDEGDVFNAHTDGSWPGQCVSPSGTSIEVWPGVESKLTMLLYLNGGEDGVQGGKTRLFPFDDSAPVDVSPRKGSALFFRHGFASDSVLHMGTQVTGTTPKYVLRINVLYADR
jgi:hypothetical protein